MKWLPASKRSRLVLAGLVASLLALLWLRASVLNAVFGNAEKAWVLQAEELGAFARSVLSTRSDLLLVQRFQHLVKRDDVAYALVIDRTGRALFHSNAAETGLVYTSEITKRALAARGTLVQRVPEAGVFEVDVPVSTDLVLRIGYSRHGFESFQRVLLGMTAFSAVLLGAAGLALFRCG